MTARVATGAVSALGDPKLLWFLNRGTGVVLLAFLTLSVTLGVLATVRVSARLWPRFVTQAVHRNVSLLTAALLVAHAATAVADSYVDIRWYDAVVPVGAHYRPLWLGLGTLACDVVIVTTVSSLLRHRLGHRSWRMLHVTTYLAWGLGVVHGVGIGTDRNEAWSSAVTVACVGVVAAAAVVRLAAHAHERNLVHQ
jgi:sulfoxide reductase heme-binding subunit YedZ